MLTVNGGKQTAGPAVRGPAAQKKHVEGAAGVCLELMLLLGSCSSSRLTDTGS